MPPFYTPSTLVLLPILPPSSMWANKASSQHSRHLLPSRQLSSRFSLLIGSELVEPKHEKQLATTLRYADHSYQRKAVKSVIFSTVPYHHRSAKKKKKKKTTRGTVKNLAITRKGSSTFTGNRMGIPFAKKSQDSLIFE